MFKNMILLVAFIGLMGCASSNTASSAGKAAQTIPSTSRFSMVKIGMGENQVSDIVGSYTDSDTRPTAKSYNPFYFGSDNTHTVQYYKGQGRIEFDSDGRVVDMQYNPAESGYK